jgi:regulator of nonsense transcripts 1
MDALVETSQPGSVAFRCFQPLPPFLEQCSWKLENCGSFVTTKTMFDGVHALATQRRGCCGIFDQILELQAHPGNCSTKSNAVYLAKAKLNASQNAAVEASLSHPLTCLWGPPGTGKTHTIVEIIKELQLADDGRRILVTAPTHNAVDNVMRKYMEDPMTQEKHSSQRTIPIRVSTDVSFY